MTAAEAEAFTKSRLFISGASLHFGMALNHDCDFTNQLLAVS
jgi:hypothetical protein